MREQMAATVEGPGLKPTESIGALRGAEAPRSLRETKATTNTEILDQKRSRMTNVGVGPGEGEKQMRGFFAPLRMTSGDCCGMREADSSATLRNDKQIALRNDKQIALRNDKQIDIVEEDGTPFD